MQAYPKGSEWRKWDLHIHSNASDGKSSPSEIIAKAVEQNLAVIALTDHHTAKNIDETKSLGREKNITVISGIEFRTEYGNKSVHIIGLFPDTHDGTLLSQKALHDCILSPLNLSETHIIAKGKEQNSSLSDEKAFEAGMFAVQVDFRKASELIRNHGGIVTVHAGNKSNGLDQEMKHKGTSAKNVDALCDSLGPLKVELLNTYVDICEVSSHDSNNIDFYWKEFKRVSIIASDAHTTDDIGKEYVWIKGDPNLNGLKQSIYEKERIYIGDIPPALVRMQKNRTKTIEKLTIDWEATYGGNQGAWFKNIEMFFNPEMTAVIGNKGSGKTAVAEIVGMLSNSKNSKDFVFLHKDKFKRKKLAQHFLSRLTWCDGSLNDKNLNEDVAPTSDELVHFVPQNSFEKLCNNEPDDFITEVNHVVFSRMHAEDKLGFTSFESLLNHQKTVIEERKSTIYTKIDSINHEIKLLEIKRDKDYKASLTNVRITSKTELDEHTKNKPTEIKPPENLNTTAYQDCATQLKKLDEEIDCKQDNLNTLLKDTSNLELLKESFENLETNIKEKLKSMALSIEPYGIDVTKVFQYSLNKEPIATLIETKKGEIVTLQTLLSVSESEPESLASKRKNVESLIKKLDSENDGKLAQYVKYQLESKEWEATNKQITGKITDLQRQIDYIGDYTSSDLIQDINKSKEERIQKVKQLFECYIDEKLIYDKFRKSIVNFLDQYKEHLQSFRATIETGIYPTDGFANEFVDKYIDSSVKSPFKGIEGTNAIKEYIAEADFSSTDGLVLFLNVIQNGLDQECKDRCYHSVFKKEKYDDFVNNFYKLKFLETRYSLQLSGKELKTLSPGERGSLLLVFYLLLDARDIPLILDQPEDNLDNQSVAEILVPFIRAAKQRRQIIIITHNANLAVVSDAEQIIRVSIDKVDNHKFTFKSGSLESEIINDVVDVLEGTRLSFNIRKNKYFL